MIDLLAMPARDKLLHAQDWLSRALEHSRLGQWRDAEQCCRNALALDPRHIGSLHHLGLMALQHHRGDSAVELLGRVIALNDAIPEVHYQIGIAFGSLGRFEDAARHNRRAIALRPDYAEAHMNLGNALKAQGRAAEALASYRTAVALAPQSPDAHYNLANQLADLGTLPEAVEHYQRALALKPDYAQAHNNLGTAFAAQGKTEEAVRHYKRAATLEPRLVQAAINVGGALRDTQQLDEAAGWYRLALKQNPNSAEAHYNLGAILIVEGAADRAATHFEHALRIKPDFRAACLAYGQLLLAKGDVGRAILLFKRANDIEETAESRALLFQCLTDKRAIPYGYLVRNEIVRALSEPWGNPRALLDISVQVMLQDPVLQPVIQRVAAAWPTRLARHEVFPGGALSAIAKEPLLRLLLSLPTLASIDGERFLTATRAALLDLAWQEAEYAAAGPDVLALHCALAQQCFLNEYVYVHSEAEWQQVARLRDAVTTAASSGTAVAAPLLVAVASYMPLELLSGANVLLARSWPAPVAALLHEQITEPRAQAEAAAAIPVLTAIDDEVSLLVQRQYEENPFPRWRVFALPKSTQVFDADLRRRFPAAGIKLESSASGLDYLAAGCGTGRFVALMAQMYSDLRITAIDLGRPSLGYAKHAADRLGLTGIAFGQADILKIGSTGRSFDVIDSAGVLHHMADPWVGWRALLSVLRPRGCMRVALYSEIARRNIVAAQKLAVERGRGRTADEIRQFRQDILALPEGSPARTVATQAADFYALSECRDLLFHVQEHRLSLPAIGRFLDEHGLQFIGFELDAQTMQKYAELFPKDEAMIDLANWHTFEGQNPDTFYGMYQFWVQRRTTDEDQATNP